LATRLHASLDFVDKNFIRKKKCNNLVAWSQKWQVGDLIFSPPQQESWGSSGRGTAPMVFCSIDWKGSKHGVDENNLLCCLCVTIPGVSSRRRFESPAFFFLSPLHILVLHFYFFTCLGELVWRILFCLGISSGRAPKSVRRPP
jgi:hypothetical protein